MDSKQKEHGKGERKRTNKSSNRKSSEHESSHEDVPQDKERKVPDSNGGVVANSAGQTPAQGTNPQQFMAFASFLYPVIQATANSGMKITPESTGSVGPILSIVESSVKPVELISAIDEFRELEYDVSQLSASPKPAEIKELLKKTSQVSARFKKLRGTIGREYDEDVTNYLTKLLSIRRAIKITLPRQ